MSQFLSDYTHLLRSHMQQVGVSSFKALSQAAGVSEWQVKLLRQGRADQMQARYLHRLSQTLQLSLEDLLMMFSERSKEDLGRSVEPSSPLQEVNSAANADHHLKQEYQRLQKQLQAQQEVLWQEFQQATLQALETWLIQFPTAAHAAQQNPQVPATRLLPLMRPIEQWLKTWGVEAIAPVGTELPFDPQLHLLMEGSANPGDIVKIRYTGYRQGDKLLYRAKVSPVAKA